MATSGDLIELVWKAKHVYVIGNGGSYANAMHIVNDLLACCIKAYSMDPSTLTAFANDHRYDNVFANWIAVVGEKGDLLIALSGSGRSINIINACNTAEMKGMDVWREFGAAQGLDMQQAEEAQLRLGHDLMRELRRRCAGY